MANYSIYGACMWWMALCSYKASIWERVLSVSIYIYIQEQLAASQQWAQGERKLYCNERTLTMVCSGRQCSCFNIPPSRIISKKKKNLLDNCMQINCIQHPGGEILIRLFFLSFHHFQGRVKNNPFYQEGQKVGKTKASQVQFGFSLPIIIISIKGEG